MEILIKAAADIVLERLYKFIEESLLNITDDLVLWKLFNSMLNHGKEQNINNSNSNSVSYQRDRELALAYIRQREIEQQNINNNTNETEQNQQERSNNRRL